mgnify:CR=1 FL=1
MVQRILRVEGKMNKNSKILVTGGCGFIGSNYILQTMKANPDYKIINLDKLTYAGNETNLDSLKENKNYQDRKSVV